MPSRFSKYKHVIGFSNALKLYSIAKAKVEKHVKFSFLPHPIYFRKNYSDLAIFEQVFINKEYDVKLNFTPKNIIDLGANVGYASLYFNYKYPNANIIAIEPETNNYNQAKKNLAPYNNIKLLNGAVWHNNDDLFLVDNGLGEAGFMVSDNKGNSTIKSYTINDLQKQLNTSEIDIIKIDIEGAELEIFENNNDWIKQSKVIIVETHDRYRKGTSKAVFKAIIEHDFSLELSGENLIFTNNKLLNAHT
jgi:FkbM family methyltransferase